MVFSSITFLLYFLPAFLLLYLLFPYKFKNIFLLFASVLFYSWGGPKFIFVILLTTTIDFFLAKQIYYTQKNKKLWLIISLCLNVGLLFYFKYYMFFAENINTIMHGMHLKGLKVFDIILPIGISFYTFESITYIVDVYRGEKPLNRFLDYILYIIFFPKLIAGPIVRYCDIGKQINDRKNKITAHYKLHGFYRFCIGLAMKVIIANNMGVYADTIYNAKENELTSYTVLIGCLAYTLQIYFDFAGYSNMALGIARYCGFILPENFNNPYSSNSVTEFWRRWHISLGTWMRNYLYIPLGGNKTEGWKIYRNLLFVFLASGFWHGAAWTFIFWGLYHGFFLVIERLGLLKILVRVKFLGVLYTFIAISLGWILFRAVSMHQFFIFIKHLFIWKRAPIFHIPNNSFYFYFIIGLLFSFFSVIKFNKKAMEKWFEGNYSNNLHFIFVPISLASYFYCVACIAGSTFNPFIYFRF